MKKENKLSLWERYLTREIGIEFKACLYFFAILFFYCVYRLVDGSSTAQILHMGEMILTCYVIGYIQVYAFANFDEAEHIGAREVAGIAVCTVVYALVSFLGDWFDGRIAVTLILVGYILITYLCVILVYRTKRRIDDKKLNSELELFKIEHSQSREKGE